MANMAKMTPEQEASYALNYGLKREKLSPAAKTEYDRLVKLREASAASRQAAAEVSRRAASEAAAQAVIRRSKIIPMSTTDTLPRAFGGDREVTRMELVEIWNCESPATAEEALKEWAQMNNYDAVIGVRLLGVPNVTGQVNGPYGGSTNTVFSWAVYGTAIGW
jgi:hypothetical protein